MTEDTLETILLGHITKELKDEIAIGRQVKLAKTIMQALRIHHVLGQGEQLKCELTDDEKLNLVKKLREETGWGMMDCRRALRDSKWDMDGAKSWLIQFRKKSGIMFD